MDPFESLKRLINCRIYLWKSMNIRRIRVYRPMLLQSSMIHQYLIIFTTIYNEHERIPPVGSSQILLDPLFSLANIMMEKVRSELFLSKSHW